MVNEMHLLRTLLLAIIVDSSLVQANLESSQAYTRLTWDIQPFTDLISVEAGNASSPGPLSSAVTNIISQPIYQIEYLGSPYEEFYSDGEDIYARNVWDLQLFQNRIYIGAGNSSNSGPAPNSGRVPLHYYSVADEAFINEYTVAEEQIDKFRILDSILYLPGHDATESWSFGNIYSQAGSQWIKNRTLPEAIHIYDIHKIDNALFAAVGADTGSAVYTSTDNANTWEIHELGSGRTYSFVTLANQLFATRTFRVDSPNKVSMFEWNSGNGSFIERPDLDIDTLFPEVTIDNETSVKIFNSKTVDEGTVYLAGYKHNDHQTTPIAAYSITDDINSITKVELPSGYIPYDVLYRDNQFHIAASKASGSNYSNAIFSGSAGQTSSWEQIIEFKYPVFARSIEKTEDQCFYFGMGSEIVDPDSWSLDELKPGTGHILRICL